ncbi:nucleoside phosphorylase domain-containing protein [Elsinoe ampelina]|uniref:Nucleoside phosphorylase domain-containing protein n=1 Tax=Elsinoe ampelina TaxID=302913 RepID=A0A6A6G6H8_9PEZI|nr:nucleoside phosphorylase domain-containing protein [Elsinoe ampelina]
MQREDYTVAWICALPIERTAVVCLLDEKHPDLVNSKTDSNKYTLGKIGQHNVAVVGLPSYGVTSAAVVVTNMKSAFPSLRFALMVGIGGGVPSDSNDIRLGDIVVSKPYNDHPGVIQYDFGRVEVGSVFRRIGHLNRPPEEVLSTLNDLEAEHLYDEPRFPSLLEDCFAKYPKWAAACTRSTADRLYEIEYDHANPMETTNCQSCDISRLVTRPIRESTVSVIHYGLIGSGNQVVKDARQRERLRQETGVLCFEMEAAGLMNSLPSLVVRGISDYADSHKNKQWQPYAAAVAAAYAKELLCRVPLIETATQTDGGHGDGPLQRTSPSQVADLIQNFTFGDHANVTYNTYNQPEKSARKS